MSCCASLFETACSRPVWPEPQWCDAVASPRQDLLSWAPQNWVSHSAQESERRRPPGVCTSDPEQQPVARGCQVTEIHRRSHGRRLRFAPLHEGFSAGLAGHSKSSGEATRAEALGERAAGGNSADARNGSCQNQAPESEFCGQLSRKPDGFRVEGEG